MPSQKFELTDISSSQTNLTSMREGRTGGCYLSTLVGFILVLLAAAVAVGVGIIVHFAGGNREVICRCEPSSSAISAEAIKNQCIDMASAGNSELCE
ncbi:unnamed protein product [Lymnaea stagnalis]|uniref:Uncharacterized protein n=1 Tax=Lymnaea stagnalis TaxID=6523 RepID=A0AAV2IP34_LYMST